MIHHPEFTPAPTTETPGPDLFMTVIMVSMTLMSYLLKHRDEKAPR